MTTVELIMLISGYVLTVICGFAVWFLYPEAKRFSDGGHFTYDDDPALPFVMCGLYIFIGIVCLVGTVVANIMLLLK